MRPSATASIEGADDLRSAPQPAIRKSIAALRPSAPRAARSDLKQSCGLVKPMTSLRYMSRSSRISSGVVARVLTSSARLMPASPSPA